MLRADFLFQPLYFRCDILFQRKVIVPINIDFF